MSPGFRYSLPTVALLGAFVLGAIYLWANTISTSDAADQFRHDATVALFGPAHRTIVKQQERLTAAQKTHTVVMTRWRTIADTATVDSVKIVALQGAANECQVALLACSERALLAEARVAELEPLLTRGVKLADCHVLGIHILPRCLSRTTSLVLGVGLGVAGYAVVQH